MSVSVLILTLNEENNLLACLADLSRFDAVGVLDSYSTDGTALAGRREMVRTQ